LCGMSAALVLFKKGDISLLYAVGLDIAQA